MSAKNKRKKKRKGGKLRLSFWTVFAVMIVVIAAVVAPYYLSRSLISGHGEIVPRGNYGLVADISHHNGPSVRWDSLLVMTDRRGRTILDIDKAAKVTRLSGIYIKATEGETMVDENFAANWKSAEGVGLRRGAYHYFLPSKDAVKQAEHFIKTVGPLRSDDLPPVLDVETIVKSEGGKKLSEKAVTWLETVEKHYGIKPMVYCSDSYALFVLTSDVTDDYPVWVAHYEVPFPIWQNWVMWQFTEKALIKGIPGPADLSVMKL